MVLGRERVAVEANLLDLVLRRQAAAAEAVDEDLRAGPGHLRQLLGHLVGIVGERVDFVGREGLGEAVVAAIVRGLVGHGDLLRDGDDQRRRRGVVAAPDVDLQTCSRNPSAVTFT